MNFVAEAVAAAPPPSPAPDEQWRLSARGREMAGITAALLAGRSVILAGEHGVGKSRLLRAALSRAASVSGNVARVAQAHTAWLPGHHGLDSWLATPPGDGPLVLGIDDAHEIDDESAERLHHLATFCRISWLICVRSDGPTAPAINRLWVERLAERIEVRPFGEAEVAAVLRTRFGGHIEPDTVRRLHQATLGNALFLRELVDHALAENSLRLVAGAWRWSGPATTSRRLRDIVRLRLGDLGAPEAELVDMVALSETIDADLPMIAELGAAAESLNRRGVLLAESTGRGMRLRLAYPLYADAVVAAMAPLTARRLRLRLADAIERHAGGSDDHRLQVCKLRMDAGETPARTVLLAGARTATEDDRHVLAERFAARALCSAGSPGIEPGLVETAQLEARTLLGRALVGQRRFADAEEVLAAASAAGAAPGELAEAVTVRAMNLATGLRRPIDALAVLDRAVHAMPDADARRLRTAGVYVGILADRVPEVAAVGRRLLADVAPDSALAHEAVPVTAFALEAMGDGVAAGALLRRHRPAGSDRHWCAYQVAVAQNAFGMGRRGEVTDVLRRIDRAHLDERQPGTGTWLALMRARIQRQQGRLDEAAENFRRAHDLADELDWFASRSWILAQLAGTLAEAGQLTAAQKALHEVDGLTAEMPPSPMDRDGIDLERATVLACAGRRQEAVQAAMAVADRCARAGRHTLAVTALHLAARTGAGQLAGTRCAAVAPHVTTVALHARVAHIDALARGDRAGLRAAARRFDELGLALLAVEAEAQAAGDEHPRRPVPEMPATPFAAGLPGPDAGEREPGGDSPLTARESEIAGLAAAGLSNRDIACRLVLSVRTVENHLQRAYTKLGIATRAELRRTLGAAPAVMERAGKAGTDAA